MKKLAVRILVITYKIKVPCLRNMIERFLFKFDGGYWSKEIRTLYEKYYGIVIGLGSYGCFDPGRFPQGTVIGNYCSFAAGVRYLNANHPMDFVSTHPLFYNKELGGVESDRIVRNNLTIGHDVWIGYGVTILSGCSKIGNGAVIGAGSVVTKDIEPYGIYAGVPAKLIRRRFPDYICEELERTKWYDESPEKLVNYIEEIKNPEKFISFFQKSGGQ